MKIRMCKSYRIIIIFGFCLLFSRFNFGGELTERAETIIIDNFQGEIELKSYKLNLDKELKIKAEIHSRQRFLGNFIYYYEIMENDQVKGYAIFY